MQVICFSKDRPLQLEGYLRSFWNAFDLQYTKHDVHVIFAASNERMKQAYIDVMGRFPVSFHPETNLKKQILDIVNSSSQANLMFATDDCIFTGKPDDRWEQLMDDKSLFGFSFRLGKNITYCHPADRHETFEGTEISGMLIWNWVRANGIDFAYPFEIGSTVYRKETVLKYLNLITGLDNWHPNIFEGNFYHPDIKSKFYERPLMMSYEQSKAHVVTVNRVQDIAANRIYGEHSTEELLDMYENGVRIDLDWYKDKTWNSVHVGELKIK